MEAITKKIFSVFMTLVMCFAIFSFSPELTMQTNADFTIRTSAPSTDDPRYYSTNNPYNGPYGLPNCTCYAYGRAWEILGSEPNLPKRGNAGSWWWTNQSTGNYAYGSTPKIGAIACWDTYDKDHGHVAVVEGISGNRVTLSESHYGDNHNGVLFDNKVMNADSSDYLRSYRFLGYIYIGEFASDSSSHSPEGFVGAYNGGEGTIFIDGAGYDPDNTNESIRVDIYLRDNEGNMYGIGNFTANSERLDANDRYGCGIYHGFGGTINTDLSGEFTLLAALIDTGNDDPKWIEAGKVSVTSKPTDTTSPDISDVKISDITKDGYKVTITVSDNSGVKKVSVPTWTDNNGQDDLFSDWFNTALATQTGENTWTYNVKVSDHNNEHGIYYTDVYAWDFNDNQSFWNSDNGKRKTIKVGMYNFTVNPNGGTMKDASWKNDTTNAVTYDSGLIYNESNWYSASACIPKRTGYTFTGFYTSASGGTKVYGADGKCVNDGKYFKDNKYINDSDLTVYAQWKSDFVSAKFFRNLNASDTESVTETFTYGTSNQKFGYKTDGTARYSPTNPANVGFGAWSRKGYEMLGWSRDRNSNSAEYSTYSGVSNNWINEFSPSVNLYAVWKAKQYNVKLVYNDGTDKTENIKVTYDGKYSGLTNPTRTGYNFNGWFTASDNGIQITNSDSVTITSDQTLYAHWSKDHIMITFDALGGTSQVGTKLVTYDNKYGVLPKAEKTGYTFGGWYLDKECTKSISESDIVKITSNQSVYAKWSLSEYAVTFDGNGGTSEVKTKRVVYGKTYGVLPKATMQNVEFIGWFTEDGKQIKSDSIVDIESDITVYAKWKITGDINSDGMFSIDDMVLLQKYILGKKNFTETEYHSADMNADGTVDSFDMVLMRKEIISR